MAHSFRMDAAPTKGVSVLGFGSMLAAAVSANNAMNATHDSTAERANGATLNADPAPGFFSPGAASAPLRRWNSLEQAAAEQELLNCCGSLRWARTLAERRPFADDATLVHAANNLWFLLNEADWLEAFACHPRIGQSEAGHKASHSFQAASAAEQSAAQATLDTAVRDRLAKGNHRYEQQNGFLYIVCAEGRTAPELLATLEARLLHDRCTELHEASRQQHAITRLRMQRWLADG